MLDRRRRIWDSRFLQLPCQQQQLYPPFRVQQRRMYHVTRKQEIVPLIAVAAIVFMGVRYSFRAVQRMRAEQEEYQYELQLYERQQLKQEQQQEKEGGTTTTTTTTTTTFTTPNGINHNATIITLAIDLGTVYTKLAAATYNPTSTVNVQISREGDRHTFNGVWYDTDTDGSNNNNNSSSSKVVKATGRAALERFYYPNTMQATDKESTKDIVAMPFFELTTQLSDKTSSMPQSSQIVTDALKSRLTEVVDRIHSSTTITKALVRHIVTVPCVFLTEESTIRQYKTTFVDCCTNSYHDDTTSISLIPEPVATVWGAQFYNLIPSALPKDMSALASYCVVDVGGYTTQVSVVQNDRVRYSTTIPWGGENIVEQLVFVLKQQASSAFNDSRSLALLQIHARQAVMELSTQSRVSVRIPYIYADPSQHHLDTDIARSVLNQAVEDHVRNLLKEQHDTTTPTWLHHGSLSPHLPTPNSLTTLWTSILTQVIERSEQLPMNVSAVLVVGGGSKTQLVQKTIEDAWNMLTGGGGTATCAQIKIDSSIQSELTVVGAATLPPSFDYSSTDGLIRRH
jgi:hypothetical protein